MDRKKFVLLLAGLAGSSCADGPAYGISSTTAPGYVEVVADFPPVYGGLIVYFNGEGDVVEIESDGKGGKPHDFPPGGWTYVAISENDFEWEGSIVVEAGKKAVVNLTSEFCRSTLVASWVESDSFLPATVLVDGIEAAELLKSWVPNPGDDIDFLDCGSLGSYFLERVEEGRSSVSAVPWGSRKSFEVLTATGAVQKEVEGSSRNCFTGVFRKD